jgi:RHS repeat-associated protein
VDYSDSNTPDIVYTLDRLGRQVRAVVTGVSTSWFAYNEKGQMVSETNLQGAVITTKAYVFDALGRPVGFDIGNAYSVRYGYDPDGRFLAVTATVAGVTRTFTYNWDAASGLLEGWSSGSFGVTRGYEAHRPVLAYVENRFGTNVLSRYDYTVDAGGRRSEAALSGSAFGDMGETSFGYSYNEKGELLDARRAFDDAFVKEQYYQYRYDQIGNRTRSDLGKWDRQFIYTANNVNQYTSRTVPDEFPVFGTALAAATVTVNSDTADRHDAYYSSVVLATNSSAAQYKKVTVEAIYNPPGTNNDYYMASTGRVFVAKTPEVFTYDADGNMTSDGRFNYEWNAENRLVKVTTPLVGLPSNVPKVKLKMDYDQQGRRISQVRSTYDGSSWVWQETRSFIYDGWNLVGERRGTTSGTTTNWYVWGLDMSGTIQGAGGVGGLLYGNFNGVSHNYYAFDGNGNVSEVVGANGAVRAHYEYDPFGSPTTESGTLADENPFRFSTKYWDGDTKILAYQLRDYGPGMGRWLSRDPIAQLGGCNLYAFTCNFAKNAIDYLGLKKQIQGKEIRRYFHLQTGFHFSPYTPTLALDLTPIGKVGSIPYTIDAVGYRYSIEADVTYLGCDGCIDLTTGELEKKGQVPAVPVLLVHGSPGDLPGLPSPGMIGQLIRDLIGDQLGGAAGELVSGDVLFLMALLQADPDGMGILGTIKSSAPKSLNDMSWVDIEFVPCPEKGSAQ